MGKSVAAKILESHLREGELVAGEEIGIAIDEVLVQDITGTVVMQNFEGMGLARARARVAVAYGDHNVLQFDTRNSQDHRYLASACRKYGMHWAKPGAGIGHQIHQEQFARPGETALGADSHTPHCGGLGMIAIGAGGMDVAVALAGGTYYLKMPEIVNVRLTGALSPWVTAKDVILEMLRRLTCRGGLGRIFEYTGPGIAGLNAQQRCTITNMGAELGATTSIFPSDETTKAYLATVGRENEWAEILPDADAEYSSVIEIDLSQIVPLVAKPSLPDNVVPIDEIEGTPIHQIIVGSCTNGSYMDMVSLAEIVRGKRIADGLEFILHPSSRADLELLAREGYAAELIAAGITIGEPTCGPCIGSGHVPAEGTNSLRVINRNFSGRSGLKNDSVYLSSTEVAAATALTGVLSDPRKLGIAYPGQRIPEKLGGNPNLVAPAPENEAANLAVERGDNIVPVPVKSPLAETVSGKVLLKVGDDITTDHIIPAQANILIFRSNIPKLSDFVFHRVDPEFSARAKEWGGGWIIGGTNYGQGSSREHAAICPMFLGVPGVIAKTFARIHKSNLMNWGLLPLTFADGADYDKIDSGDEIELRDPRTLVDPAKISGDDTITNGVAINKTKGFQFAVTLDATKRERKLILAGGRLAEVKGGS
ncbi:MAG: aconitate hydratase [bacterium]|jgi:aconitate hydratase